MPEGMLNKQEFRVLEDLNKNVKTVGSEIKKLNDTIQKQSNKSNQNTLMFKLVQAVEGLSDTIKKTVGQAIDYKS